MCLIHESSILKNLLILITLKIGSVWNGCQELDRDAQKTTSQATQ